MVDAAESIVRENRTSPPILGLVDKLGTTTQFARAAEQVNLLTMSTCARDYVPSNLIYGEPKQPRGPLLRGHDLPSTSRS